MQQLFISLKRVSKSCTPFNSAYFFICIKPPYGVRRPAFSGKVILENRQPFCKRTSFSKYIIQCFTPNWRPPPFLFFYSLLQSKKLYHEKFYILFRKSNRVRGDPVFAVFI